MSDLLRKRLQRSETDSLRLRLGLGTRPVSLVSVLAAASLALKPLASRLGVLHLCDLVTLPGKEKPKKVTKCVKFDNDKTQKG